MGEVETLAEQVAKLGPMDLARLRTRLLEFDARTRDRQSEADAQAGKLDELIGEALADC